MSKDKSSSTSIWDEFSEKIESLREALKDSVDENDSSEKPSEVSDAIYHFTANDSVSLDTIDIESLRKALNTPIDEIISADKNNAPALETQNDFETIKEFVLFEDENPAVDKAPHSNISEKLAEIVEENDTTGIEDSEDMTTSEIQIQETDESDEFDTKQDIQNLEEVLDIKNEMEPDDLVDPNLDIQETDETGKFSDEQEIQENETEPDDLVDSNLDIQETDETDKFYDEQESRENETEPDDLVDPNLDTQETDETDKFYDEQESQENEIEPDDLVDPNLDIQETDETDKFYDEQESQENETGPDDLVDPNIQIQETDKLNDKQEKHDVEIKIKTEKSIKNEKIDNYWKQGETSNPYILKVDESREKLNKSLEMARELVNQQSEEPKKQEKKRFQFGFSRSEKNGNHKSNTVKEKEKPSKKSKQFKPMVYEMLEPQQESQTSQIDQPDQAYKDSQDNQAEQSKKVKQDKGHKGKTKQSDDRINNDQEKEIINHRNRLAKSRSLGVPVFVKKPVNLEQIRQLKTMLISQNNVKILVDTGSSQGRLLVISGQDPDTLLTNLGQLSIVKSTVVEDETINISL